MPLAPPCSSSVSVAYIHVQCKYMYMYYLSGGWLVLTSMGRILYTRTNIHDVTGDVERKKKERKTPEGMEK